MAAGADEFDAILEFDARRLAAMAMSPYGQCARLRRALCMWKLGVLFVTCV